jgi:YegS/Rv2252/BmrU family lipid kinase
MGEQKVKVIVNPNADLGRAWQNSPDLRKLVEEYGTADWTGTVFPVHAKDLAIQAAKDGFDLVIAVGGDGTIHEVVNGLMQVNQADRPRLGIIPFGSGNDFAHAVGVDPIPSHAIAQIFNGMPRRVDIGKLEDQYGNVEYWTNALGVGFDSTVVIRFREMTRLRGFLAYLAAVLKTLAQGVDSPHLTVVTDSETWEDDILMLVSCNGSREGGGFLIAPEARPDDGILNYAWIEHVSRLMILRILPEVMKGTHEKFAQVRSGEFKSMSVQSDRPLHIHTDGEIYSGFDSDIKGINIEILPGAIELLA